MKHTTTHVYTVTATITVTEDLDSTWHKPFTAEQAKRLAREISPMKGAHVTGGAYTAEITRVSMRKAAS